MIETTSETLICTVNDSWRVVRVSGPVWGSQPTWLIQEHVDGGWRGKLAFRMTESVREFVKYRAGPVDPAAAQILASLPLRCPRDPRPPIEKKRRPAGVRPVVPAVAAVTAAPEKRPPPPTKRQAAGQRRAAVAARFLNWRARPHAQS
jgi:hypothetical protein